MTLHVFTGPTLTPDEVAGVTPSAVIHPPVGHGDLLRGQLLEGDTVVLIDGLYHQQAPVRHKEILLLIERGVHVIGCSSMGALRAAELHACGMIGHGRVFEMYRDGEIEADDEVAVVHGRDADLSSRNTPLVNVRWATEACLAAGVLTSADAADIVAASQALHYTERSWRMLRLQLDRTGRDPGPVDQVLDFLRAHPEHASIKRRDALDTLQRVGELVRQPATVISQGSWRNRFVYEWDVDQRGDQTPDGLVSDADLIRWHQLFSRDFPRMWRAFVLGEMAGDGTDSHEPEVAARWLGALRVTSVDRLPCLTEAERSTLSLSDAMVQALVRSFESPRAFHDLRARFPQLTADAQARSRVRMALRVNAQTWWRGREPLVDRLPTTRLMRLLADVWGCANAAEELAAAGRDRGFGSLDDAIDVARVHFLAHQALMNNGRRPRWRAS